MKQRLGIAAALLHDPAVLVLDEPLNGLDPDAVVAMRGILQGHAARGGTVVMASHNLDEAERVADSLVLMADGRVHRSGSVHSVLTSGLNSEVLPPIGVRSDDPVRLCLALEHAGAQVNAGTDPEHLMVHGISAREVALAAQASSVLVWELAPTRTTLADAYFDLTPPTTAPANTRQEALA